MSTDFQCILLAYAAVAQLDRVLGYEPRGRGFDSCQPHQKTRVSMFTHADPFVRLGGTLRDFSSHRPLTIARTVIPSLVSLTLSVSRGGGRSGCLLVLGNSFFGMPMSRSRYPLVRQRSRTRAMTEPDRAVPPRCGHAQCTGRCCEAKNQSSVAAIAAHLAAPLERAYGFDPRPGTVCWVRLVRFPRQAPNPRRSSMDGMAAPTWQIPIRFLSAGPWMVSVCYRLLAGVPRAGCPRPY